jgi:putative membrane protein
MTPEPEDPRQRLALDRTLLANERTLAAWIRTGLSVAVVGLAAVHLLPAAGPRGPLLVSLGAALVLSGVGVIVFGAWRFATVARALGDGATRGTGVRPAAVYLLALTVALLLLALLVVL